jgi:hypothetical protein
MSIGGVPGAYAAVTHTNMARPSTLHHFIVKRSRSYIVVTAWLSSGGLDAQLATIKEALSDWQIDLLADKPEPGNTD